MKDDNTLRQQKISKNSKVMLVGSKLNDVMAVNVVSEEEKKKILQEDKPVKEPLSKSKVRYEYHGASRPAHCHRITIKPKNGLSIVYVSQIHGIIIMKI